MAVVTSAATGAINAYEGTGASLVILVAMIIPFAAAGYFTGRLYGKQGMIAVIAGMVLTPANIQWKWKPDYPRTMDSSAVSAG